MDIDAGRKRLVSENTPLFWWVDEGERDRISDDLLVETILSYGSTSDARILFDLLGLENVAGIFHRQLSRKRNKYHKRTANYFRLYFSRHVQKHSDEKSS